MSAGFRGSRESLLGRITLVGAGLVAIIGLAVSMAAGELNRSAVLAIATVALLGAVALTFALRSRSP